MGLKRKIYYQLSPKMRRLARRIYYGPIDLYEGLIGKRDAMTPPKGRIFIGPGDFKTIGEKLKYDFIHYGGLKHGHKVLDVGCGIGRIAIPLTHYIDKTGSYDGFDIVKEGIDWCRERITPLHHNFNFKHVPLYNDLYNTEESKTAEAFTFPYKNEQFDFVILTSVFTHMQPEAVARYLKEIARVMKPDGICFVTFFIIDRASEKFLKTSPEPFFPYEFDTYYLHDKDVKDANIAYKLEYIESLLKESGLRSEQHHPGWWSGREKLDCVDFQDVLILKKQL